MDRHPPSRAPASWRQRSRALVGAIAGLVLMILPAGAAGWTQVFDDEFPGTALDRSAWATRLIYEHETLDHLNDEAQRYRDNANHLVADGRLSLMARKVGQGWESGMIRSTQTFYYGYFETRVKFPKGRGIWPAFWLDSDYDKDGNLSWPPEIDIFEFVVNGREDKENMIHSAGSISKGLRLHFDRADPKFNLHLNDYFADGPLNDDWHVFGLLWLPHAYSVFLDGKELYSRNFEWIGSNNRLAPPAHVILNFALGGQWAGRYGIDESQYPQSFQVDYVRVCQFAAGGQAGAKCPRRLGTPDLSQVSYDAVGDMKRPAMSKLSAGLADGQASMDVSLSLLADTSPGAALAVVLREVGKSQTIIAKTVPLDPGALATDAEQRQTVTFEVPPALLNLPVTVLAGLVSAGDSAPKNTLFRPVLCESAAGKRQKMLLCPAGSLTVGPKP
jgi:beta-glucanase (GH16 family)